MVRKNVFTKGTELTLKNLCVTFSPAQHYFQLSLPYELENEELHKKYVSLLNGNELSLPPTNENQNASQLTGNFIKKGHSLMTSRMFGNFLNPPTPPYVTNF